MKRYLPITGLPVGEVSPAVIVCGDPARASKIAGLLTGAIRLSDQREYRAYRGEFMDTPITVCSHGVGAPGAAVAFEELIAAGAKQIIRVGTCGGIQPDMQSGDLVVVTAAVDVTGYGRETVPPGYPAVADMLIAYQLHQTAAAAYPRTFTGLIITRDNFYGGVVTPYTPDYQILAQARVLAVEMECAALFHVANVRDVQAGAILAVDGNVLHSGESIASYDPHQDVVAAAVTAEIQIALRALHQLAS
ncbi:MAG: nucleoside phosphorylase [Chloroflexi bacterium]|nr:nucleoside phosphorylase [Chloroflexota bacterium]MBP8055583.1 nucleoside phosphorylase [Chloroflexota bacterium]